jgi:hypothetical protein
MRSVSLPKYLYRVVWEEGFGWPDCTHTMRTHRNFDSAQKAAEQVTVIRQWPHHHQLVGIFVTETGWESIQAETLPLPESVET